MLLKTRQDGPRTQKFSIFGQMIFPRSGCSDGPRVSGGRTKKKVSGVKFFFLKKVIQTHPLDPETEEEHILES